jgi:hypothetical protein
VSDEPQVIKTLALKGRCTVDLHSQKNYVVNFFGSKLIVYFLELSHLYLTDSYVIIFINLKNHNSLGVFEFLQQICSFLYPQQLVRVSKESAFSEITACEAIFRALHVIIENLSSHTLVWLNYLIRLTEGRGPSTGQM